MEQQNTQDMSPEEAKAALGNATFLQDQLLHAHGVQQVSQMTDNTASVSPQNAQGGELSMDTESPTEDKGEPSESAKEDMSKMHEDMKSEIKDTMQKDMEGFKKEIQDTVKKEMEGFKKMIENALK